MSARINMNDGAKMISAIDSARNNIERIKALEKEAAKASAEREKAFKAYEAKREDVAELEIVFQEYAAAFRRFDEYCKERERVARVHAEWERDVEASETVGVGVFNGTVAKFKDPGEEPPRPEDIEVVEEPTPPTEAQRLELEQRLEEIVPFAENVLAAVRRCLEIREEKASIVDEEAAIVNMLGEGVTSLKAKIVSAKQSKEAEIVNARQEIARLEEEEKKNKSRMSQLMKIVGIE